jgi:hypothetical protein
MPLQEAPADAMALRAPDYLPKAIIQIPIRDPDGNANGGVRLPDMAAPPRDAWWSEPAAVLLALSTISTCLAVLILAGVWFVFFRT